MIYNRIDNNSILAGPHSAVGSKSECGSRGCEFDLVPYCEIISTVILLLRLIQEGLLSVTNESMCMKNWLTA